MFFRPIRDKALPHPCDEILIHDVARNTATGIGILDRTVPGRNGGLFVGFAFLRDTFECPSHAESVFIVHGNAPLEVTPCKKRIRPETHTADRPEWIRFCHSLTEAPIDETIVELLEVQLEMLWRVRPRFIV